MKYICLFGLLVLVFSGAGISAAEIPDLLGNWSGSGPGYNEEIGYLDETDYDNTTLTLAIEEQKGRLFTGNMTYLVGGTEITEGFAGVIGADNKTFYIAEFDSGYDIGTIITDDEIELIYLQDGESIAEVSIYYSLYRIVE